MGGTGDDTPGIFARIFSGLYGDLPMSDRLRVAWLAGTLFFIIGGYWLLRSLKDPIVATIVGVDFIPRCKMLSLVVVFSLVFWTLGYMPTTYKVFADSAMREVGSID
ncbi:unnamed protein product [Ectocarpus sp. 12 AP-2014]